MSVCHSVAFFICYFFSPTSVLDLLTENLTSGEDQHDNDNDNQANDETQVGLSLAVSSGADN